MKAVIGLADLRTVRIGRVPAGQLFYAFGDGKLPIGLSLKVRIKTHDSREPFWQAYVTLDGEKRFQLFKLDEELECDVVLPILAPGISVKLDIKKVAATGKGDAGCLLISPFGPCLKAHKGNRDALIRLSDGEYMDPSTDELCFVTDWQLISVSSSGAESLLVEVTSPA